MDKTTAAGPGAFPRWSETTIGKWWLPSYRKMFAESQIPKLWDTIPVAVESRMADSHDRNAMYQEKLSFISTDGIIEGVDPKRNSNIRFPNVRRTKSNAISHIMTVVHIGDWETTFITTAHLPLSKCSNEWMKHAYRECEPAINSLSSASCRMMPTKRTYRKQKWYEKNGTRTISMWIMKTLFSISVNF